MVALVLAVALAATEVERVLALVNLAPVLASDAELAELAGLVPRQEGESDASYRQAVVEALVALELRWQDLAAAGVVERTPVSEDVAWQAVARRAGGEASLQARLAASGLDEVLLRDLVRRAAVVEAYVARRFAPFVRPSKEELEQAYASEVVAPLQGRGQAAPGLEAVREQLEALLRERKLAAEVERWTAELERRAEVVRYLR